MAKHPRLTLRSCNTKPGGYKSIRPSPPHGVYTNHFAASFEGPFSANYEVSITTALCPCQSPYRISSARYGNSRHGALFGT
jgi:hypothetical protein